MEKYVARFSERSGVEAKFDAADNDLDLPPASRLVLLRILQEALTNAAKHSEATEVDVSLARAAHGGAHCVIRDNGRGFDVDELLRDPSSRQGFGLRTMKERAASIGGDARIESEPGAGTQVSVFIPG